MTASKVALAATAALAGAFFADKRYGISIDLNQLHQEEEFGKRLQDRIEDEDGGILSLSSVSVCISEKP